MTIIYCTQYYNVYIILGFLTYIYIVYYYQYIKIILIYIYI